MERGRNMKIRTHCTEDERDEVFNRYAAMVYRIALTQTRSASDAEDIFQEVFLRYFQKERTFQNGEHKKAWLINVTLKCCKKFRSSSWFRKTVPLKDTLSIEMPAEESAIYDAILELPEKYRRVIQLFYFEEMSVDEIHQALGAKPSTIRTQLTRGRAMLREKLRGEYFYG